MEVLWCITGGGYLLDESCKALCRLARSHRVTLLFSKAGREVADSYGITERASKAALRVVHEEEQGYSSPLVGALGSFRLVVISPCTANTAAKIVLGIADSLVSNIAAQALKSGMEVAVVPTDFKKNVKTATPSGREITIRCRGVDLGNARRLEKTLGVRVLKNPDDVLRLVDDVG